MVIEPHEAKLSINNKQHKKEFDKINLIVTGLMHQDETLYGQEFSTDISYPNITFLILAFLILVFSYFVSNYSITIGIILGSMALIIFMLWIFSVRKIILGVYATDVRLFIIRYFTGGLLIRSKSMIIEEIPYHYISQFEVLITRSQSFIKSILGKLLGLDEDNKRHMAVMEIYSTRYNKLAVPMTVGFLKDFMARFREYTMIYLLKKNEQNRGVGSVY